MHYRLSRVEFIAWCQNTLKGGVGWYLSMPPTKQDLTQGPSYSGDLRKGEVALLVIGSLGVM